MSPLNYSPRGAPVNLGVYDFLVKMDFLGVFDTFPAEALLHFLHRLLWHPWCLSFFLSISLRAFVFFLSISLSTLGHLSWILTYIFSFSERSHSCGALLGAVCRSFSVWKLWPPQKWQKGRWDICLSFPISDHFSIARHFARCQGCHPPSCWWLTNVQTSS